MHRFSRFFYVFLIVMTVAVFGVVERAFAGLVINQARYQQGVAKKDSGQILVSKNRMKFVSSEGVGLAILNLNTSEMIQIDNQNKRYVVAKPSDYVAIAEKTKAELQKQLAAMPPAQRAQIEQKMKAQGMSLPGEAKTVKLDLKKTGKSETIGGFKSDQYEMYEDAKLSQEFWVSKEVGLDKEIDMKKMADYTAEIRKANKQSAEAGSDSAKIYAQIYDAGFPTRIVYHAMGTKTPYIEEVTKVENRDIPESEFQVPAGYKKVTMEEMMMMQNTAPAQSAPAPKK